MSTGVTAFSQSFARPSYSVFEPVTDRQIRSSAPRRGAQVDGEGFVDIWACVDDVRKVRAAVQAIPAEVIVVPLLRVQFMAGAGARTQRSLVGGQTIKIGHRGATG